MNINPKNGHHVNIQQNQRNAQKVQNNNPAQQEVNNNAQQEWLGREGIFDREELGLPVLAPGINIGGYQVLQEQYDEQEFQRNLDSPECAKQEISVDFLGRESVDIAVLGNKIIAVNNLPHIYTNLAQKCQLNKNQINLSNYKANPNEPVNIKTTPPENIYGLENEDIENNEDEFGDPSAKIIESDRSHVDGKFMHVGPSEDYPEIHTPWKIHIRIGNTREDWNKMTSALVPYLADRQDTHFKVAQDFAHLPTGNQQGKGITIYPQNKEHFETISRDLAQIIENNGLADQGGGIAGDRALGDNGRLFYRYESHLSNLYKYDPETGDEKMVMLSSTDDKIYSKNRGDDNYMAEGMTEADDPFFNFNPLAR